MLDSFTNDPPVFRHLIFPILGGKISLRQSENLRLRLRAGDSHLPTEQVLVRSRAGGKVSSLSKATFSQWEVV